MSEVVTNTPSWSMIVDKHYLIMVINGNAIGDETVALLEIFFQLLIEKIQLKEIQYHRVGTTESYLALTLISREKKIKWNSSGVALPSARLSL